MAENETPFWHPSRHADRRAGLLLRGRVKAAIRRWFEDEGFIEVETACLQVSPGNEAHLHAFRTDWRDEAGATQPFYLHTSPEFACKKLLAAGEKRIFTFAPVFRNGERSALHSPEFTMLEWYRAGEPYAQLMDDCAAILRITAETAGRDRWSFRDRSSCVTRVPERISVDDLFQRYAGIRLIADTLPNGGADRDALAREARRIGVRVADDDTWSDLFSRILVERIEPAIGVEPDAAPVIVDAYPTHEAALARPSPDDPRVAERFELYACGVELANAFGELVDPAEQRRRLEAEMDEKERVYGERYPIDEDFLAALAMMPPASGCAMGFDRLVMLAAGASRLDQVLWTPVADPGKRGA
ncbi:MAG: EF-P lysine aminoacylase EpmA [Hyphomicrobiaceae bacterium]